MGICTSLTASCELLPQLSRVSPRLLKGPRHFFGVFLKLLYNTPPPKSFSFHTNQIRGLNQARGSSLHLVLDLDNDGIFLQRCFLLHDIRLELPTKRLRFTRQDRSRETRKRTLSFPIFPSLLILNSFVSFSSFLYSFVPVCFSLVTRMASV